MDISKEGRDAYWAADESVKPLILSHAVRRVESMVSQLGALNQRLSAVAALLFAGAAVSATFTSNSGKVDPLAIWLAAVASAAFAIGGACGFAGLHSRKSRFPGERPSWWTKQGAELLRGMKADDANYWIAGHYEEVIYDLERSVDRRGTFFNRALVFGLIGGLCVAGAAGLAAFKPLSAPSESMKFDLKFDIEAWPAPVVPRLRTAKE